MSKKFNQRIPDGVINLSPEQIARDRKLRVLYEAIVAAKGRPEEAAAREKFAQFVREEYP
jgi:ribosomal protein S21